MGYKGIRSKKGKKVTSYYAQIEHGKLPDGRKRRYHSRYFRTREEAARAYDRLVYELRGPTEPRNFPDEDPTNNPLRRTFSTHSVSKRIIPKSSKFRGVHWSGLKKCWVARITYAQGKKYHLGAFETEEKAARAYDAGVKQSGLTKKLNFPDDYQHVNVQVNPPRIKLKSSVYRGVCAREDGKLEKTSVLKQKPPTKHGELRNVWVSCYHPQYESRTSLCTFLGCFSDQHDLGYLVHV